METHDLIEEKMQKSDLAFDVHPCQSGSEARPLKAAMEVGCRARSAMLPIGQQTRRQVPERMTGRKIRLPRAAERGSHSSQRMMWRIRFVLKEKMSRTGSQSCQQKLLQGEAQLQRPLNHLRKQCCHLPPVKQRMRAWRRAWMLTRGEPVKSCELLLSRTVPSRTHLNMLDLTRPDEQAIQT